MTRNIITSLCLLFTLISCAKHAPSELPASVRKLKNLTVYPSGSRPAYAIKFQKGPTFGSTKQVVTGSPRGVAVDGQGRVFVGDTQEMTIHVYSPDGRLITHLGRKGKGPGEFTIIGDIRCDSTHLFVYDLNQRRLDVFSLQPLEYSRTINLGENRDKYKSLKGSFPDYVFYRNDGKFLVPFSKFVPVKKLDNQYSSSVVSERFYLLDQKGDVVSQQPLKLQSTERFSYLSAIELDLPFYGRQFITMSGKNRIYISSAKNFLIRVFSPDGMYRRAFYYPYKNAVLTGKELDAIKTIKQKNSGVLGSAYTHLFQLIKPPDTWPAINDMLMDDHNRLWIATIVKDQDVYKWWVLTAKGKLLGRFTWPGSKQIQVIKNGYVYTIEPDEKTGIKQVVRYKFDME